MSGAIEQTVKALTDFESELDSAKAGADESRKRMVRSAGELSSSASAMALEKARGLAAAGLEQARKEAEREAESIKKKGRADLEKYEESISKHKKAAVELVLDRLLGEGA